MLLAQDQEGVLEMPGTWPQVATESLVGVDWLRGHVEDPGVVPLEVGEDASAYHLGHIPGATSLSWLDDLNEPDRRGAPSQSRMEALLGARGITRDTHLVLYGDQDNAFAAYALWMLRYYGHFRASLLDGGRRAWLAAGAPVTDQSPTRLRAQYVASPPDEGLRLTRDTVLERFVAQRGDTTLIDCRTPAEYHGEARSAIDVPVLRHRLGGHIPGARNISHVDLLIPHTGQLRPQPELRALFAANGIGPESDIGVYCSVGERSALCWFALQEVLDFPRVRLYDGGWAEYGSLVGAPVHR